MLQKRYACRDVNGMLQVMARDQNGGACLLGIVGQQMFEQYLTGGVEEVERLVENDHVGLAE